MPKVPLNPPRRHIVKQPKTQKLHQDPYDIGTKSKLARRFTQFSNDETQEQIQQTRFEPGETKINDYLNSIRMEMI